MAYIFIKIRQTEEAMLRITHGPSLVADKIAITQSMKFVCIFVHLVLILGYQVCLYFCASTKDFYHPTLLSYIFCFTFKAPIVY